MKPTTIATFFLFVVAYAHAQTELTPKCEMPTLEGDPPCWMKIANHADCYFWNALPKTEGIITWSGQCLASMPDGRGKLTLQFEKSEGNAIGTFVDGEWHGRWEFRGTNGDEFIGHFVDGKRHGDWEFQYADGRVHIGSYANGDRDGVWIFWTSDGEIGLIGSYVNGKKNGKWHSRSDHYERTQTYVDGKLHGRGEWRWPDGRKWCEEFSHGEQVGEPDLEC